MSFPKLSVSESYTAFCDKATKNFYVKCSGSLEQSKAVDGCEAKRANLTDDLAN